VTRFFLRVLVTFFFLGGMASLFGEVRFGDCNGCYLGAEQLDDKRFERASERFGERAVRRQ